MARVLLPLKLRLHLFPEVLFILTLEAISQKQPWKILWVWEVQHALQVTKHAHRHLSGARCPSRLVSSTMTQHQPMGNNCNWNGHLVQHFYGATPPPSKKLLTQKKSWGIIFGVIATVSRNQLRKKILWEIFSWELRKFRVTQHGRVWGLCGCQLRENNSWGVNLLVITQFCRNRPPQITQKYSGRIIFVIFSRGGVMLSRFCLEKWKGALDVVSRAPRDEGRNSCCRLFWLPNYTQDYYRTELLLFSSYSWLFPFCDNQTKLFLKLIKLSYHCEQYIAESLGLASVLGIVFGSFGRGTTEPK